MRLSRTLCLSSLAAATLATLIPVDAISQTVLFSDPFELDETLQTFNPGAIGSTGWTFVRDEVNQNDTRFAYDYSEISIPEAPNSQPGDTATSGVALRTNVAAGAVDQAGMYYEDASFTGNYRVQVDMWLNWANDAEQIGTTEHAGLFIGKDTIANPANADFPASTGAGAIFSSDGDCSNCDHILLKNEAELDTFSGQYSVREFDTPGGLNQDGYDNTDINTNPANGALLNLSEILPSFTIPGSTDTQAAGTVGFRWVTITADVDTTATGAGLGPDLGTATFSMNVPDSGQSYVLGTVDNSIIDDPNDGQDTGEGPVDMSGRVSLSIIDFFTSVSSDIDLGTVVFDNLLVTSIPTGLDGDYNGDGVVDASDYTVYRDTLGDSVTIGEGADGNGNGVIDDGDRVVWADNYGATAPGATAVPEPSTAAFCVLAIGALARRRRRS